MSKNNITYTAKEDHIMQEVIKGVQYFRKIHNVEPWIFEEIMQSILSTYHDCVVRGRKLGTNIPLDSNNNPIRSGFGWGKNGALRAFARMRKEWAEEGKHIQYERFEEFSSSESEDQTVFDFQYEKRDADEESWTLLSADTPEEDKKRIRKKRQIEEGSQPVVVRPTTKKSKPGEPPFVMREIEKERQVEIKKATADAFDRALNIYDEQELSLFNLSGYSGKPIYDYLKRQRLARLNEKTGKYKLNGNAFLLRAVWALVGDEKFEALARVLSGKTIRFPSVEQQLRANQKHIIFESRKQYDAHKKRYYHQERLDAGLLEDLSEIGERTRDGFVKEIDYMSKFLGLKFIGKLPDQIDESRVSQIFAEEKELHKEYGEYAKNPTGNATINEVRRILARLTFIGSLKQLLHKIRASFRGV